MKAMALLSAAAIFALNTSSASSQGACMQEYQACMDSCSGRSSKTIQDSCFTSCEGKNNFCAERVYGKRPFNGGPSTAADQRTQGKDALAKKETMPDAPQDQVANERAPQQAPQAAPRQGAVPSRR